MPLDLPKGPRKRPLSPLVGALVVVGCVNASRDFGSAEAGPTYGLDAKGIVIPPDAQAADAADGQSNPVSALCGTVNIDCGDGNTPDDVDACLNFVSGTGGGGSTGTGGFPALGSGGFTSILEAGVGDAADASSSLASDAGGPKKLLTYPRRVDTADAGPAYACQVASTDNNLPVRRCGRTGAGAAGAPCSGSGDCRAGLACVGTQGAGQCRPYCCKAKTSCGIEKSDMDGGHDIVTYCGERPLIEGSGKAALLVPVCVPADGCRLEEPYPCTTGNCTCPVDTACGIVGFGTTSCVKPGPGKLGDACPCAAGYFCSNNTKTCEKICKTSGTDLACAPGQCQATAGFPDGFGLCVGATPNIK